MNGNIVVAIDADLSPATQLALHVASSLLELSSPQPGFVLLHIIPVPDMPQSRFGTSRFTPTAEQREVAVQALHRARIELQKQGIVPEQIGILLQSGIPADEIVKVAKERDADCIVIGRRGNSLKQKIRRLFMGSTSRSVLKLALCPVMIASLSPMPRPRNLVTWYTEAITAHLHEHPGRLMIFTSCEAAHLFAPSQRTVGCKEVDAASIALEQLARSGVLFCQKVNGELRFLND
jgi:nucleotide-binding universal stress UspA family protein